MKKILSYLCVLGILGNLSIISAFASPLPGSTVQDTLPADTVNNVLHHLQNLAEPQVYFYDADHPGIPLYQDGIWWIAQDPKHIPYNILLKNAEIMRGYLTPYAMNDPFTPGMRSFNPNLQSFIQEVDNVMLNAGFNLDSPNSSTSDSDDQFYDFVHGYSKKDTLCTLTIIPDQFGHDGNPSSRTDFEFGCSNQLEKYFKEQVPLLKVLTRPGDPTIVWRQVSAGGFTAAYLHGRRWGSWAILQEVGVGNYIPLWIGVDEPPCSLIQQYNIPTQVYENHCYN